MMIESIVELVRDFFDFPMGKELLIFILSMSPVLELRGGMLAASILGMNPIISLVICIIGNIIPIPFILWLVSSILEKLEKTKLFGKMAINLEKKALSKSEQINKYGFWGLILLVGIPLPGTGAWTGCLVASLLEMDKKKAALGAVLGVIIAGLIMYVVSFLILGNLF